ncbi:MAG: NAD-dependent deacetylase [bacterium]|nr:NAD-dependent deacetylase [bacterium]
MSQDLAYAARLLLDAEKILVFTGAGISTESGIPDFRGTDGIWTKLSPEDFQLDRYVSDPKARIRAWQTRFPRMFGNAQPNPAHEATTKLWKSGKLVGCVTQNIDGLHQAAGLPQEAIAELHGNGDGIACIQCGAEHDPSEVEERWVNGDLDPHCDHCGGILKSTIVFFGEVLPQGELMQASEWAAEADAVVSIGSSLSVYPAAYIPLEIASRGDVFIIINNSPTDLDSLASLRLDGMAGTVFPQIVDAITS